jgi:hypothetical protein
MNLSRFQKEFFKNELEINTFEDLVSYIRIFDYWMVNKIPIHFYDWVFKNKDKININLLKLLQKHLMKNYVQILHLMDIWNY